MDVNGIAYIKVKIRTEPLYYWGLDGNVYGPSILVHPDDVTLVKKSDLAYICESEVSPFNPARPWYNINNDDWDSVEREVDGRWKWTSTPGRGARRPNVWICTVCAQPKVMDCLCGYNNNTGKYSCIHKQQDPAFQCRSCKSE
jgi:hypothetical protein